MARPETDPLETLREQIRSTAEAADRLAEEAVGGAGDGAAPPLAHDAAREAQALAALLAMMRDLLPPELRRQVADLIRQVLLLVRAVLDWWVARLEPGASEAPAAPPVEDIPLD